MNIIWYDSIYGITYPNLSGNEGGGNLIHMNYDIQSTPTAVLITPDRAIVEQYIWPPTHNNLNDAILAAGGIMVGVDEGNKDNKSLFSIYPNPTKNNANISFSSSGDAYQVQIISLTGNIVYQTEKVFYPEGTQLFELTLNKFKKGMYFVRLRSGDKVTKTQSLIIL